MNLFRGLLVAMLLGLFAYTAVVLSRDGLDLVTPALADIGALGWSGQFLLDFMTYLVLSALWVAWRHRFTPAGIGLALVASVGGILFLGCYLLAISLQAGGDMNRILLGDRP